MLKVIIHEYRKVVFQGQLIVDAPYLPATIHVHAVFTAYMLLGVSVDYDMIV